MISISKLYKIGPGPSSSHTIGVKNAIEYVLNKNIRCDLINLTFYGSLAKTGKGHLTDYIAHKALEKYNHTINFNETKKCSHPNTMCFSLYKDNKKIKEYIIYSIGGGLIKVKGQKSKKSEDVYPHNTFTEIKKYCKDNNLTLIDYIYKYEDKAIHDYIDKVIEMMLKSVENGLKKDGVLPGKLNVQRKAKKIYEYKKEIESDYDKEKRLISAYAFAVSEENASGENIVTAPTCGSSGVLPSLLKYVYDKYSREELINAMLVAGLIGVIVVKNASISGAECGCQAEIGTASSMGAAFLAFLDNQSIDCIERASEIAMEHSLGMTCDPIEGYVQIPCIERNALGAFKSIIASTLSKFLDESSNKISFDMVVKTMYETGLDMNRGYKETALKGLSKKYHETK